MEFVSMSDLARFEDFIRAHMKVLDEQPNQHPDIENYIAICYRENQDEVLAALKQFPTTKRTLLCQCDDSFCGHFTAKPAMFAFNSDFALGLVEKEAGRYTVTLTLPDKTFLVDSQRFRKRSKPSGVIRATRKLWISKSHIISSLQPQLE
jgi:hypothetical protein